MLKVISETKGIFVPYAPKITQTSIHPDKIRDVIGPKGYNSIIAETGVKIDIEDSGQVYIYSPNQEAADRALKMIEAITRDVEAGDVYTGKVVNNEFGAFVELMPGKEGLVHISKLAHHKVDKVEDVLKVGDEITVKVTEIDSQGRINLSHKDTLPPPEK